jgi:hypothetical protein
MTIRLHVVEDDEMPAKTMMAWVKNEGRAQWPSLRDLDVTVHDHVIS